MAKLEYFYSAHSSYSYLGSAELMKIANDANCRIIHKPFDLRVSMEITGPGPISGRTPERKAYFYGRDIERWAEWREVPFMAGRYTAVRPAHHDNDMTLVNCMLIAGQESGVNVDQLADFLLRGHWRDDADLADFATLIKLGHDAGVDSELLLGNAALPKIQAIYQANTNEAIERSVFGAPTYFVDGDMFFGQDRLMMVERALKTPFEGTWPRV
jgi:2-hydroxychromene-2-carboxylate isomerase